MGLDIRHGYDAPCVGNKLPVYYSMQWSQVSENVEMIQPLMSNISNIFGFGHLVAKRRIRLDRNLFCEATWPRGMYKISASELPPDNELYPQPFNN
jgi:hypothetical protein